MNHDKKVFAFKLADKKEQQDKTPRARWKAREGVSIAGCSDPAGNGNPREDDWFWGYDQGYWC
jgi:hypothetical protein